MAEKGMSRGKICFTLEELMKLIFSLQHAAFDSDIPVEGQRIASYMGNLPARGTRSGLDDRYMELAEKFLESSPREDRVEAGKELVAYATQRIQKTSMGRKVFDTGAAITVVGQTLQMLGPLGGTWAVPVGEFFETVGALTAIGGGFWIAIEEIFDIDPGYREARLEEIK